MPLHVYNTLTAKKEEFHPVMGQDVRMYVCGITPYDVSHLGHARCYVVFDVIKRVLASQGFKIRHVQNFTDVDDKIIARAAEKNVRPTDLAQQYIDDYFNKMDALGVQRADLYPRVTQHIPDIIALIRKLIDRKKAYGLGKDVYYSVRQFPDYGKLSKRPLDELQSGARIEINKEKHDPLDFALWKASKPGDPPDVSWESPWGHGRPGWHIECSVMALKHLGANFDIHGGGLDLIFPHHENEIAQSEGATGHPFAHTWIHNGFVTRNQVKMSKSLGNFFTLSEIFAKYQPAVVRYMLLTVHYRSPLDFSDELLDQSRQSFIGMRNALFNANRVLQKHSAGVDSTEKPNLDTSREADALMKEYRDALCDDFNTPEAIGVLFKMVTALNKQFTGNLVTRGSVRHWLDKIRQAADILGLDLFSFMQDFVPADVTALADEREVARQTKNWAEADRLRKTILERGYVVEDTSTGPRLLPKASS